MAVSSAAGRDAGADAADLGLDVVLINRREGGSRATIDS